MTAEPLVYVKQTPSGTPRMHYSGVVRTDEDHLGQRWVTVVLACGREVHFDTEGRPGGWHQLWKRWLRLPMCKRCEKAGAWNR